MNYLLRSGCEEKHLVFKIENVFPLLLLLSITSTRLPTLWFKIAVTNIAVTIKGTLTSGVTKMPGFERSFESTIFNGSYKESLLRAIYVGPGWPLKWKRTKIEEWTLTYRFIINSYTGAHISSDSGNKSIEEATWEDPEETIMKKKVKKKKGLNGMSEIRKWLRKNGEP